MKTLFTYALVLSFSLVLAQRFPIILQIDSLSFEQKQDSIFNILNVSKMAIFPGCETAPEDKMACVRCFSTQLNTQLIRYVDSTYPATDIPKPLVSAHMQFVTDVEGYITQIEAIGGDPEFFPQAIDALTAVARNMARQGMLVKPAELDDSTKVSIIYHNKISLLNHHYKRDVIIYLHQQGCTTNEIYERLPEWDINNVSKEKIGQWTKRLNLK